MGFSLKNLTHPSKWDLTGDTSVGEGVRNYLDGSGAADAAKARQDAAIKAAAAGQAGVLAAGKAGQGMIDTATGQATTALTGAGGQAQASLGQGNQDALAALLQGSQQAQGALGAQPNRLADLLNGGLASGFQADPGYQFRLQQGEQAINRSAAAHGGRMGGATLQALLAHGQNLASQEFQNYAGRTIGLAGGADQGDFARNSALSNLLMGAGQGAAGLQSSYGNNLANLQSGTGSSLANLIASAGTNKANVGIGAAGQSAQLGMAPVQYAGGEQDARNQAYGNLANLGIAVGTRALL